ncbi:hypothetical protein HK101_002107 [Irineochytrium annulatum]|nr:hypothetical protein HK101_002107 [Irineochytrium annulatum]
MEATGYTLAVGIGEHIFQVIDKPLQVAFQTAGSSPVNDVQAYTTQLLGWNHAESQAKEGLRQHIDPALYSKLQVVETCHDQWRSILRAVNYSVAKRRQQLNAQIEALRQGRAESDIKYAERAHEILSACQVINHPNQSNHAEVVAFDKNLAQKFLLGFREERLVMVHSEFTRSAITKDFPSMRDHIRDQDNLLTLSRVQRRDDVTVAEQAMQAQGDVGGGGGGHGGGT